MIFLLKPASSPMPRVVLRSAAFVHKPVGGDSSAHVSVIHMDKPAYPLQHVQDYYRAQELLEICGNAADLPPLLPMRPCTFAFAPLVLLVVIVRP